MKRVLVVAYYFPPLGGGGTQRTLKFVRYLPEFGWQPHLLTVRQPHHLVRDDSLLQEVPRDLPVTATSAMLPARFLRKATGHQAGMPREGGRPWWRMLAWLKNLLFTCAFIPDEYAGWVPAAVAAGKRLLRQSEFALIYSSGPPNATHVIARLLSQRTGLPWVADLRDLWDQYPDSYNPWRWRWRARLDDWLEKKVLGAAQHLVVVSLEMQQHLLQKGVAARREQITVITNGYDPADFAALPAPKPPDRFTIVHSGTLYTWRSIHPFLAAWQRLPQPELLRLELLGIVPQADRHAMQASGLAGYIDLRAYLPYRETLRHLRDADALLLLIGKQPHATNVLTSKLFDYIGAQRPILALGPAGAARRLIEQEKLGVALAEEDTPAIAAVLAEWLRQRSAGRLRGSVGDHVKYHRRELTAQLARVFEACVSVRHSRAMNLPVAI
ncbi:MAG: glycosyltransferase [candidate division KSB1 bacterium]|nr:glycosyltransferase [candidate division KSB1 bacterium]MDZ7275509.1 glycosyltransferase [candidate division KSB1 bacterium]MDZ7286179.1 glycosyltransferase [candidate division KSB1 bacterium]MDZ7296405.1 glycosyltransferase [candidate division KSB1 bacterium]MDZ7306240.1 glycosyltransferase [candidate division KSB1 bacterium]